MNEVMKTTTTCKRLVQPREQFQILKFEPSVYLSFLLIISVFYLIIVAK